MKCIEDEIPFELPEGWEWIRLASILSLSSGKSIKVRQLTDEGEYPVYGIFEVDFLVEILKYLNLGKTSVSTAQPVVSGKGILPLIIPVPPKNEQFNILQSYNQIILTLNILEQHKEEALSLIATTKSKILDLAIRGQLVPQNPNDEPASVLLECIRVEKKELIKQGKIKRDKKESIIFKGEDNSYYRNIIGKN